VGSAVGTGDDAEDGGAPDAANEHAADDAHGADDAAGAAEDRATVPAGLHATEDGYRFAVDDSDLTAGRPGELSFRILGPDGEPVRDFVEEYERELHLIVVGTDLATYRHLHPERAADGTWSMPLDPLAPGVYRAYADFAVAGGPELTLCVDLPVSGDARYAPLPAPADRVSVDGYVVSVTGTPVAGETSELTFEVSRGGRPVTDLEPYLGAFGHLVAIRSGDLAYLHVHPLGDEPADGGSRGGPAVRFGVEVPSAGDYRLFLEFAHDGEVRTAPVTVHVPGPGEAGS
jgi:hypothetical protein